MCFIDEFVEPLDLDFLSAQIYACSDLLPTCTTVCMYVVNLVVLECCFLDSESCVSTGSGNLWGLKLGKLKFFGMFSFAGV